MAILKIKVEGHLKDRLLEALKDFESYGIQIEEESTFEQTQAELYQEFNRYQSGQAKTYSLEEADLILEEAITKYENKTSR
ncbi:MAG: hypothetical protein HWE07_03260 [Cytophagia bacterium]|nr:hypothetical protein [Cytophagia bacterium]